MGLLGGLEITTEVEGDNTVVALRGKVTIGVGDVKLRNAIRDLLDQGVKQFMIDLKNVTKIDSSGIGELVAAYATVTNQGGHLEIRNLPPGIHDSPDFPDFPNFPDGFGF